MAHAQAGKAWDRLDRGAAMKAAVAASFDAAADSYEQTGVAFFAPLGRELARRAGPQPGESVLDLGCGRGHVLLPVAEAVGPDGEVIGTDLSAAMVAACVAEATAGGLRQVSVEVGDAAAPDFPPESFDLVTAGMVMFFLPEPRAAVRAVARVLRRGGRFAMSSFGPSDPKFDATMSTLYRHREGPPWEPSEDKPFDTVDSIAAMLAEAGLADVEITEMAHDIRFPDLDAYWAWVGSHGGRIMIEEVAPERLPAARAEIDAMLAEHLDPDGGLTHRSTARFTTARRPA